MADAVKPQGNPAVVGLAGFAITTTLLQFHNMGWGGTGTVFCAAMIVGGLMQLMAGFQEFKCGNNFGYSAFCAYGAFWMALGLIWLLADAVPAEWKHLKITPFDIGLFLVGYTIYTLFMWVAAIRIHTAMALTFTTLIFGFVGLDLVFLAGMKNLLPHHHHAFRLCLHGLLYDGCGNLCSGLRKTDSSGRQTLGQLI